MGKKRSFEATRNELLAKALSNPLDNETITAVASELDSNPKYSLEPDPTGEYGMTTAEKNFTKWYVQHRNIAVAAQLAEVSVEDGMAIYRSFACQSELRRIDLAWKLRQINSSTLTLDQMGAMLTSYILDQMPAAERLSTKDKMSAMKMVMDIHALKQKVVEEATPIDAVDVESQVKDLSVDALKALIQKTKVIDNENDEKEEMIKALDNESALSNDDLHYLRSLPVEELKKLVDEQQDLQFTQTEEMQVIPNPTSNRQKLTPIDEDDVVDGDDVTGS